MISNQKKGRLTKDPRLLFTIYFAFLTNGMMSTMLGTFLPHMQQDYNLSYVLSGSVLSAHQIGNLCAVFIAGFLPFLIGRKKSVLILLSGIVVGMLAMTLTGSPIPLLAAFAATGIGRGMSSNISNVVVSEICENKGTALNLLHALFAIGALLAPFTVIGFAGTSAGWRAAAWTVAVMEGIALLLIATSSLSSKPSPRKADGGDRAFLTAPSYWLNTAIMFFYLCSEASIVGWLVTYFKDSGLMGDRLAQASSSILWIMVLAGRLVCAAVSARGINRQALLVVMALGKAFFFVLMITSHSMGPILISVMGVGFCMAGIYPTTLSTMEPRFSASTVATGTCIGVATLGAVVMPSIVGWVAQRSGITGGISMISVALVVLVTLTVIKYFREGRGRARSEQLPAGNK